jgi:hypothetical protein
VPAAERRFGQAPIKAPLDERVVIAMGLVIAKGVDGCANGPSPSVSEHWAFSSAWPT